MNEVDVFFGPEFYGETYNQIAMLEDDGVAALVRRIWANRNSAAPLSVRAVKEWDEYSGLAWRYPKFGVHLEAEVRSMCAEVKQYNEPP